MAGNLMPWLTGKRMFFLCFAFVLFSSSFAQNPIVTENALPGNPISEWGVPDFRDSRIAGFTTQMSVNAGTTVRFKITVQNSATYTLKIYRIGYYNGNGARLVANLGTLSGVAQPSGLYNAATGLLDCDNWSESASWAIPGTAVSGLYIAKIERTGGGSNHIAFIVRNDASNSDLYLQFPDATWQAYNAYGGNSVYDGTVNAYPNGHAVKVSYNRPFFIYNSLFNLDGRGSDWYMNAEYPMVRWLERNGYNITYTSCEDISANPGHLLTHKVYISVGHDEYVSKEQRNAVEAARDAGVNLAFFSGNEFYWKTRYENDASGDTRRTLVCYKEGLLGDGGFGERTCGGKCDATSPEWTGLWRTGADYDGNRPENALTGQMSWDETPGAIQVPSTYKKLRFWRNTSVASLTAGQTATLAPNTLAYEWDYEQYQASYPAGRITMSSTTLNNKTHKLSLYRHSSGALVFGAGTVQWSWGLDGAHYNGSTTVSTDMQQATVNLFADMGVQPGTLQSGLVGASQSSDLTAPSSSITSPATGSSFHAASPITVSGSATDAGGGVVAGVEVSYDGGITWQQATISAMDGAITWTYTFTPGQPGSITVKSRGFDDSGNKENPGAGISLTITPALCPCSLFTAADVPANLKANDGQAIAAGMRFRVTQDGTISGVRYYKGAGTTGTHTGKLWSSTGTLLATATFTNETASGWQTANFPTAINITANTTYMISYHSPSGDYASTSFYFSQAKVNGYIRGLADGEDGGNGTYDYVNTHTQPGYSYHAANYFADIVFNTNSGPDNTPPTITSLSPPNNATGVAATTTIVANFSEAVLASTVTASTFFLKDAANNTIPATLSVNGNVVTLTPSTTLSGSAVYTAKIKGGAGGVTDLSSNALAIDTTWTFTTAAQISGSAFSIFQATETPALPRSNDGIGITLGTKFKATQNGQVVGFRYYKGAGTTGTHTGYLWSSTGTQLASATFTNETASGWQQVLLSTPVDITANTTYIVAYFSPSGDYASTNPYFTQAIINGPLRGLATGEDGTNGVYAYAATATFPASGNQSANYWADVVFSTNDVTPPAVSTVTPLNAATNVAVNTTVTAVFNEAMTASTVTASTVQLLNPSSQVVTATVSYNTTTRTVTLTPSAALAGNTTYTARIIGGASGVKDAAGNALASTYSWTFTTIFVDVTPPTVISVTPTNGASGVSTNPTITAVFSEAMTTASISATTVEVRTSANALVTSTVNYDTATRRVTITPNAALATLGTYTAKIIGGASGVKDIAGNALATTYSWSFTIGLLDLTAPTVISNTPADGATGIPISGASFKAVFSESMTASTINTTNVQLTNPANTVITATVAYNATTRTVTLTPSAALAGSTVYKVTIKTGVKDAPGNALAANYVWSFTTAAAVDNTKPIINSVTPVTGSTNIALNTTATAVFSEAMNAATINTTNVELRNPSNVLIAATVAYNAANFTMTLTPSAALTGSTVYTVTVKGGASGVTDVAGNVMGASYSWSFTTVDNVPPTVTSVTPTSGSTGVGINSPVTGVFSEAMTASTITTTNVELRNPSNALITATVSYNATTRTVTLTPSAALANNTVYTATIKGGSTGVKDAAGNALASNYVWSFTTVQASSGTGVSIFASNVSPVHQRDNDGSAIELGTKFRVTSPGIITAIRYWKGSGTTGVHLGNLWSSTGTLLGTATFTNETASGWQTAYLATPVSVVINTTYVASYFSPSGDYSSTNPWFSTATVNGPLRGLASGEDGGNGVYRYTTTSAFPSTSASTASYFADVIFEQSQSGGLIAEVATDVTQTLSALLSGPKSIDLLDVNVSVDASRSSTTDNTAGKQLVSAPPARQTELPLNKELIIFPNPSTSHFMVQLYSRSNVPVTIRVMDIYGRVIDRRDKIAPVGSLQIGQAWRTGTYFVEVTQGNDRKVLKVIKTN